MFRIINEAPKYLFVAVQLFEPFSTIKPNCEFVVFVLNITRNQFNIKSKKIELPFFLNLIPKQKMPVIAT